MRLQLLIRLLLRHRIVPQLPLIQRRRLRLHMLRRILQQLQLRMLRHIILQLLIILVIRLRLHMLRRILQIQLPLIIPVIRL